MTRVLILAGFAPSLCNFRGQLIEDLCARGHEVHAAAPGIDTDEATQAWLKARGVKIHSIPLQRAGLSIRDDLRTLCALTSLMRRIRPEYFVGYTVKPVVWGLLAAERAGVPNRIALITGLGYAFSGQEGRQRALTSKIVRFLYRHALKCATLIFFQNPDDRTEFAQLKLLPLGTPVVIVNGSGVDLDAFDVKRMTPQPTRFLLIARLLGDKGIREYVEAARRLRVRWPDVECHLIGGIDSNPSAILEADVQRWHNVGDVVWHGALPDVREAIANSHVYVLPSYREGTPRTVLEAMATGRAIITTDAPGCRETVQDGINGFLVPVRDVEALTVAMERFIIEPELSHRMGIESRRIAAEKYDVRKVNEVIISAMGLL